MKGIAGTLFLTPATKAVQGPDTKHLFRLWITFQYIVQLFLGEYSTFTNWETNRKNGLLGLRANVRWEYL